MRLKDKVCIVTGTSGYIGQAYATRLAQEGAKVVLADVVESPQTLSAVEKIGGEVLDLRVDVTSEESTKEMARRTVERFGRIDCLLNNAGIIRGPGMGSRAIEEVDLAAFDRVLAVNIKGVFLCIRAVVPYMKQQGGGKIINISSGTWLHPSRGRLSNPHYVASKAAVAGLTRAICKELGQYNINVNCLAPGATPHDQADEILAAGLRFDDEERPLGRPGVPDDLTGTAVFLFSEDSDFITGQMILVNGGMETW